MREHGQTAVRAARPLLLWSIPIKLHPVCVGVAEINGFTDTVNRRTIALAIESAHLQQPFRPVPNLRKVL